MRTLEAIVAILQRHGENVWSKKLQDDLFFLRKGDVYGAERFLTYIGGMGSLQDLIICPENGHAIAAQNVSTVNDELTALISKAYASARALAIAN